ncbi:hypothetical protein D3C85_1332210 [compost metagenome]
MIRLLLSMGDLLRVQHLGPLTDPGLGGTAAADFRLGFYRWFGTLLQFLTPLNGGGIRLFQLGQAADFKTIGRGTQLRLLLGG